MASSADPRWCQVHRGGAGAPAATSDSRGSREAGDLSACPPVRTPRAGRKSPLAGRALGSPISPPDSALHRDWWHFRRPLCPRVAESPTDNARPAGLPAAQPEGLWSERRARPEDARGRLCRERPAFTCLWPSATAAFRSQQVGPRKLQLSATALGGRSLGLLSGRGGPPRPARRRGPRPGSASSPACPGWAGDKLGPRPRTSRALIARGACCHRS